ncbi:MAG: archaeal proteasome endopeptidase complex subunit beta [Candidatus Korarchaeota archaeon]
MDDHEIVKTGTTTVGVVCKDGVILGTESQATLGNTVASDKATKIYKINDYIAATIAGSVADCQHLVKLVGAYAKLKNLDENKRPTVKSMAALTSNLLFRARTFPFLSELIIGGYDDSGPKLYSMDPLGSLLEDTEYTASGSGAVIALGVLEAEYNKKMTIAEGVELVKRAITAAKQRDIGSGGAINIAIITKDGIEFKKIQA